MFLKQYNYKPRQPSVSSDSGSGSQAQTATTTKSASPPPAKEESVSAAIAGRRRSSVDQKYAGLHGYKRSSMDDKRSAYADQSQASNAGVLGNMWNSFTTGSK